MEERDSTKTETRVPTGEQRNQTVNVSLLSYKFCGVSLSIL